MANQRISQFVLDLFSIEAVRFGRYTLKGGHVSPIYFDLRLLMSHPKLLKTAAELVSAKCEEKNLTFDVVCGVPMAALPLTTAFSLVEGAPMILQRQEAKSHGTQKLVEGSFNLGDHALLIEDTVVSGRSIWESASSLKKSSGIVVDDAVVLLDRKQGAAENLANCGVTLHSCLDVYQVLDVLRDHDKIGESTWKESTSYFEDNQFRVQFA